MIISSRKVSQKLIHEIAPKHTRVPPPVIDTILCPRIMETPSLESWFILFSLHRLICLVLMKFDLVDREMWTYLEKKIDIVYLT